VKPITLPYTPREAFLPFHNRKARFATLVCHRRAGKTVALVNDLIIGALECPLESPQFAYIAPNYQQAKRIAWEYLKKFAAPVLAQVHEAELRVTLKNSAKIYLLGAERADSLRGIYLDGAALDEFAQIRPSAVSQVIMPSLSDRNGWLVYTGTPMGKNHFYDVHRRARDDPTWFSMLLKASQSRLISQDELDLIKQQMDDSDYQQEFECSFEAALKGAIYGTEMDRAENEGRIREHDLDPCLPVDVVCDLGYTDDTVLCFFQQAPDGILIHEVYSNNEQEWEHYLDVMETHDVRDVYLPHDARAKNLQTGRSIVEQTLRRGYRPRIVPDHKLRDGIAATRKLLPYCYWNLPLCSGAIEAMKSYRRGWDDVNGCYRETPVHDWSSHIADAIRYLGVVCGNLRPERSRIILPGHERDADRGKDGANYAFNLDDLFNNARTNPGLMLDQ
jgi:phage terminase large subunit